MNINDKLFGFTIKRIRPLGELDAEFIEMTHDKTGLELVWINRNEENKTFGIAFKTLPFDDTGIFHILEHSVLGGSDKYPVKEPFVNLLQTSMSTFLNALTFPDKTLYPISSRNDKDFFNLMSVYLDAVFCPSIYSKPEIFEQEGWHYEIDENNNACYKGVVFNEMKGVFASPDELEEMEINKALFPDTPYKFVSGGDPASIPDLSYENFIKTHKKFYSPSNAYIFLDGAVNIEKTLEFIDNEYLSKAEKGERIDGNLLQKAISAKDAIAYYELGENESEQNKTRVAYASVIGTFEEREKIIAMQVLSDVLCGSNQSILTKSVLSKGLAQDVITQVYDGVAQPWIKIEAQNITDNKEKEVEKVIFDTLKALAENGIDRLQLDSALANLEFRMRERDYGEYPQGIAFNFIVLESWLYGGDPIKNLIVGDLFDTLRLKANEGYFEKLIKDIILNNPHKAKVTLLPSYTIGNERREKESKRIFAEMSCKTDAQKNEIMNNQIKLIEWQNSVDSEKATATVPKLKLEDVRSECEILPTTKLDFDQIKTLYHNVNCSGICNFNLYFDAEDLSEDELSALSFLTDILGKMKTTHHSEEELDILGRLLFGTLDFSVIAYPSRKSTDNCKIKLCVMFSMLEKNIEKAIEFVIEVLNETSLENESVALDLIKQLKTRYFQDFIMSGSNVGAGRIKAMYSSCGVANECTGGIKYYKWLCEKESNWNWAELKAELNKLINKTICKNRLTLSLTGGNEGILQSCAKAFSDNLNNGTKADKNCAIMPWGKISEGIVIPAEVCFACAGGKLKNLNCYNGSFAVASKITSLSYLWNTIRVQGGAYGCGCRIDKNNIAVAHSYRDPNAVNSLKAFKGISDFLGDLSSSDTDLSGFIIGAVSSVSPLYTPKMKGFKADEEYFTEITQEDKKKELLEILSTDHSTIAEISKSIADTFENGGICVLGNREELKNCNLNRIIVL